MSEPTTPTRQHLGLWDAVSIIVGIVVGAGIYETAPFILANVSSPWMAMLVWGLGGLLSLVGALCYAELATTYPQSGGDYVYLTRAFGPLVGFLFGWAQLTVILTASLGAMAFVFADYAVRLWDLQSPGTTSASSWAVLFAAGAVTLLSIFNVLGSVMGKRVQNLLTVAKIVGLTGVVIAGFGWGSAEGWSLPADASSGSFGLAMILVLYTFGGWNDAAFVAAEIRNPQRNIVRALVLGIACITLIYLLVNAAYIWGLGFERARNSAAIAADTFGLSLGTWGAKAMCLLVILSALGACNGLIFVGARIYSRLGADHVAFAKLAHWHPRLAAPIWSLVVQAAVTLVMLFLVGLPAGQQLVNQLLQTLGLPVAAWAGHGGFETLVTCSAPVFWAFFLLTGISLFVLRKKDRDVPRPFTIPLYPWLPLLFCVMCAWMLYTSIKYIVDVQLLGAMLLLAVVPLLTGVMVYALSPRPEQTASIDQGR